MPEEILEVSPEMLEHQAQKERSRKRYESKNKKHSRSQWGDDREDGGWPDYEY